MVTISEGDGAGMRLRDALQAKQALGAPAERAHQLGDEGIDDLGAQGSVVAAQIAQPPGQGANPLAQRHLGQDALAQVHGGVGHAAGRR